MDIRGTKTQENLLRAFNVESERQKISMKSMLQKAKRRI